LQKQRFGGAAAELEAIGAYQVAMDNIEKASLKGNQQDGDKNKPWWEKKKEKSEAAAAAAKAAGGE